MDTGGLTYDVALDCRELTKPNLSALAQIVLSLIKQNPQHRYLLLSDAPLAAQFVPEGSVNRYRGRSAPGGLAVVAYQYWMKRTVDAHSVRMFYEVDHYALFKMKRVASVAVIHDVNVLDGITPCSRAHRLAYRAFLNATLRNADLVVVDSEFTRGRLAALFKNQRPVVVLPVGIDQPHITQVRPAALADDAPFILALGRLSWWKGSARLASLFEHRLSGRGVQLVFAGRCDDREAETRTLVEGVVGRCPDVLWLDYVTAEEREWLLCNARLVCYPAIYDGFGMPPLEAAVRNTPCLMNDIPVLREVTQGYGLYADYFGEDQAITEQMWSLISAQAPRNLVSADLRKVASTYTWDRYFDRLFALLGRAGQN